MYLFGIYVLSEDPPVFAVSDNFVTRLLSKLPRRVCPELLLFPQWTKEPYFEIVKARWHLRRLPHRRTTWMCTTPREVHRLGLFGYRALWCHQNLFCDESTFRPAGREKK